MATTPRQTSSFTNTKGEKIITFSDGSKKRNGVLESKPVKTPKTLPVDITLAPPEASGPAPQDGSGTDQGMYEETKQNVLSGRTSILSNANKVERVVPLLKSQASLLGGNTTSGDNQFDGGDGGGEQEQESFDELLGFGKKKKKKGEEMDLDPYTQQSLKLLQQMQNTNDRQAKESINALQEKFNQRQAQQEQSNASGLAQVKQALNLGGSSRYAPVSSQGIVSAKEAQGIQALSALDAEEQSIIRDIKSAQTQNDYQLIEKKMGILENVRKEKATARAELDKTFQETEMQASRDNAISGLVAQGITDPVQMLDYLNFDESGKQVGDFTIKEVTTALKSLNELRGDTGIGGTGFKLDNKQIGQLLGAGLAGPDIQAMMSDLKSGASLDDILEGVDPEMQDAVKEAFGIKPGTNTNIAPGKGAKTSTDEAFIRTRLFSKLSSILNKGTLSDADREIIDKRIGEFRDAGFGEQEILDRLAGLPPEVTTPYNGAFRDAIVNNSDTIDIQNQKIGILGQQLNSGNYKGAMETVERFAMNNAQKLDPSGYMGNATAQNYLKKGNELSTLIADAEDIIGPLQGSWENVKGKLGKSKSAKAATISAKIAALTAEMRHDLSGTAVTPSESAFLEPLIPSLSDTMDNFGVKIKALNENALSKLNTTRNSVSLPTVSAEQVIDPKKRLILYSNDIYLPDSGDLDI